LQLLALALHLASENPLQRDGFKTSSFGRWRPELTLPLALFESVLRFRLLDACWVEFASNRIVCIAASSTFDAETPFPPSPRWTSNSVRSPTSLRTCRFFAPLKQRSTQRSSCSGGYV
jgi:hypothetical protein